MYPQTIIRCFLSCNEWIFLGHVKNDVKLSSSFLSSVEVQYCHLCHSSNLAQYSHVMNNQLMPVRGHSHVPVTNEKDPDELLPIGCMLALKLIVATNFIKSVRTSIKFVNMVICSTNYFNHLL